MRVLLIQSAPYLPSHGGANKSNRLLLEALAAKGHDCRAIAPAFAVAAHANADELLTALSSRGIAAEHRADGTWRFRHQAVSVTLVLDRATLRRQVARTIERTGPTWILVSSEDPGQMLMAAALGIAPERVVYLARTTAALPCGPDAVMTSATNADLLRRARASIAISQYVRDYLWRWAGVSADLLPISLQPPGPYPDHGRSPGPFVTMINPCAMKGLPIFLSLASHMPHVRFAAVPTWGTTPADRAQLDSALNIHVLPPADDIDAILCRTRVLVVPSLWAEAKGRIILEALLRGIPVLASRVGGIPEAMLGLDYVLAVNPIARYAGTLDEEGLPLAVVPAQDVRPWRAALERLLGDAAHYADLSRRSRAAALAHVAELGVEPFESFLQTLSRRPAAAATVASAVADPNAARDRLGHLSAEQRRLILLRARGRSVKLGG